MKNLKKRAEKLFAVVLALCVLFASLPNMGTIVKAETVTREYDFGAVGNLSYSGGVKGDLATHGWYLKGVGFTPNGNYPNVFTSGDYMKIYVAAAIPERWVDIGIDVPEAGTYDVSIQMGTIVSSEFGSGTITLGGKSAEITSVPENPTQSGVVIQETPLGKFDLEAGENTVRIELADKIALFIKGLVITKSDGSQPEEPHEVTYDFSAGPQFAYQAEGSTGLSNPPAGYDAIFPTDTGAGDYGTNGWRVSFLYVRTAGGKVETFAYLSNRSDLDNNDYGLRFYAGYRSYMEIELDVPAAGSYVPTLTYSTNKDLGSIKTTLTLNGSQICVLNFRGEEDAPSGQIKGQTFRGGAVDLKAGKNILKVLLDESDNAYLTSLKLTPESEVEPPEFPEINTDTAVVYDFHKPLSGDITKQLWGNVTSRIGAAIDSQPYGIRVNNESSNSETVSVDIYVPEDGVYYPVFSGYQLAAGGGKYELSIGGESIGEYSFYNSKDTQQMNPVRLTKGVNQFQLECRGPAAGAWGRCAYLTELKLYYVKPDAEVVLSIGNPKPILYLGQDEQLSIGIEAADETLFPVPADSITSSNPDVIAVDASGVLSPQAVGSAKITASGTLRGTPWEKSIDLEVVKIQFDHLSVKLERQNLFIGQKTGIKVSGFNNDGSAYELDPSKISYQVEPEGSVEIADGKLTALQEAETVTITVKAEVDGAEKTAVVTCNISDPEKVEPDKKQTTIYTEEDRANAAKNIEENAWAKAIRDAAVSVADDIFAAHPDDAYAYFWETVTTQYLPRACVVSLNKAEKQNVCPSCGKYLNGSYGSYPWVLSVEETPWKIKCPNCSTLFPTNDFEAYYKGGIDENGNFDPVLAKAHNDALIEAGEEGNLVNKSGQHTDDPNWGVDNGYGWKDSDGIFHNFIAYYNHRAVWSDSSKNAVIEKAICYLTDAYLYTGDAKYANLGIVLLDRIADVYPDMDLMTMEPGNKDQNKYKNSHGGTNEGKIIGCIWEATSVQNYIRAYDAFYPVLMDSTQNGKALAFLSAKAEEYKMGNPKSSGALVCKNIEDNLLRVIYPEVKDAKIRGNFGMHQAALALAAVCLDSNPDTKEWLDFTFQTGTLKSEVVNGQTNYYVTGGDVMATLINKVDRDGFGNEVAPGYNLLWIDQLKEVADVLDGYTGYEGADLYQNPKFMKMFSAHYPLILCQKYLAQIGDSGETGNMGISMPLQSLVEGYAKFEDPILAQLIYYLNGETAKGLHVGIFESNPNGIGDKINAVIEEKGTLDFSSENLTGYGFAVLRGGIAPDAPGGQSIDFKTMSWTTTSGIVADVHTSGVVQYHATLDNEGAWIEFQFDLDKEGEYNILLTPFSAISYGIYDILIDGEMVYEGYNFCTGGKSAFQLAKMNLAEGGHTIRFENARPHETSSALKLGVTRLEFYTDEDLENIDKVTVDPQRDVWLRYGSNSGHGHRDTLNLGVHAFGLDVAPDNGYVTNATENARRYEWEANTISHNTVVVDASKQKAFETTESGTPLHFDGSGKVQVVDVDDSQVYDQTSMYRRTLIQVAVDDENAYTLDLFRVRGGSEHVYSFHGAEGTVTTEGLNLVKQEKGSYAGEDVPFGQRPNSEGGSITGYTGGGYQWLRDVQKQANPESGFSVEWDVVDGRNVLNSPQDIRLRLTMLNDLDDVALAIGEPPNFPNNPDELTYLLARTKGEDLNTTFTSVIEPYNGERYISKIEEVTVSPADEDVKAVKITLANGRVDYVVNALDSAKEYTVDNLFQFSGFVGVYSTNEKGRLDYLYVNDGGQIAGYHFLDSVTGSVVDFTKNLSAQNTITLEMDQEYASYQFLVGRDIYVENAGAMNGTYRIKGIQSFNGNRVTVELGNTTLIQSYVDSSNLESGYRYTIAEGDSFRIPLSDEKTNFSTGGSEEELPPNGRPDKPEEPQQPEEFEPFCDLDGHWAKEAIESLAKAGVVKGVEESKFLTNATASRAEFVAMLARALKLESDADAPFSDVAGTEWYAGDLAAAAKASLVKGFEDGTFRGGDKITRQEAMALISRALDYLGIPWEEDLRVLEPYSDRGSIAAWAEKDAAKLVGLGIVQGADGKLNPLQEISRAEIAMMLYQVMERFLTV